MSGPAHDLIDELAADLAPVERLPRIRWGLAGALGLWCLVFFAASWMHDPPVDVRARLASNGTWAAISMGLMLAALAGAIAGLAGAVPGREDLERRARWVGLGGLVLAVVVGVYATFVAIGVDRVEAPISQDAWCFAVGASIGLVPGAVLLAFVRQGHVLRPGRDAMLLLVGSFSLGALAVQVVCQHDGARHMLLGHAVMPLLLLTLAGIPLSVWLSQRAR